MKILFTRCVNIWQKPGIPIGPAGGWVARAHIQFIGLFEGREVVWDARIYALRISRAVAGDSRDGGGRATPGAVAGRPFIDIAARGSNIIGIKVGLAVAKLDVATLLKTMIMVAGTNACGVGALSLAHPCRDRYRSTMLSENSFRRPNRRRPRGARCRDRAWHPRGGWCPRGRRAEDGVIAKHYPLRETLHRLPRTHTPQCARRRRYADRHRRRIARRHRADPRVR